MELLIRSAKTQRKAKDTIEEREIIAKAINSRRGQAKFRQDLISVYGRCLVTGCQYEPILEAAHIEPYAEGGTFEIENGLLLRSDIHTLFDLGLIGFFPSNENYLIIMSEDLDGTEYQREYKNKSLLIPNGVHYKPNEYALKDHLYRANLGHLC